MWKMYEIFFSSGKCKKCKCHASLQYEDYFSQHLATCNDNCKYSNDFFPSIVEAYHKQFIAIDQGEETNSDYLIEIEI